MYDDEGTYLSGSIIEHAVIAYGGGGEDAAVTAQDSAPCMNNVTVHFSANGGLQIADVDDMRIKTVLFEENTAEQGGAIYAADSSLTISDSYFVDNTNTDKLLAVERGGALYCVSSSVTVDNSSFSGGIADEGGAIYFTSSLLSSASMALSGCTFTDNTAEFRKP